jgi:O-acetyl-ADP-ribose deacetylase (regulator of RNase III)
MRLTLVAPDYNLVRAWDKNFPAEERISIHQGLFQDIKDADGLATAGNSYGLMDGGIDLAVANYAPGIEDRVQHVIRKYWNGELQVGQCTSIEMDKDASPRPTDDGYKWLFYAPTMRIPKSIVGTDNVYRAMWAILQTANQGVKHLVVPGLGTLTGKVPPSIAAHHMAMAWYYFNNVPEKPSWGMADARNQALEVW